MRVITGTARGRKLITLDGDDVRPTTDVVKEAMFSIIQFEVEGSHILDLFGGSGQLAVEALSRGAASAVIVDASKKSIEIINQNLETTGLKKNASVINSDSLRFLMSRAEKYDIAFLDPPYSTGLLQKALEKMPRVMSENGIIICEAPATEEMPEKAGDFELAKKYKYGKTALFTYRVPMKEED